METIPGDSTHDTILHIAKVHNYLNKAATNLTERGRVHDASKLQPPEKEGYDQIGIALKGITYGSPEYKESLRRLKPTIDHHYAHNSHHPQHYPNGILGMSLFDVLEMLLDWKAAGERHDDGDIWKSIEINTARFNLEPQVVALLSNTAKEMGW